MCISVGKGGNQGGTGAGLNSEVGAGDISVSLKETEGRDVLNWGRNTRQSLM